MLENDRNPPFDRPTQVFRGIRFVLLGFDPINHAKALQKLVDGGGVDAGLYGPNCTHVIVDKLVYDDPLCVAARRDGKILVSALWVDHSFDVGVVVDTNSVMYRPVKDLNGIPGAQSLVICLTGYQRQDREDIMTMVSLMGATFSKPLIATKVTHLICYKFEGEKYALAKKMKRIKLINHQWLEDCLKAWEILSEEDYNKSGYELEMMEAEAKDSEEEAEGLATRHIERSPHHSLIVKQEPSGTLLNSSASKAIDDAKDPFSTTARNISDQFPNTHDVKSKHLDIFDFSDAGNPRDVTYKPSNPSEGTLRGSKAENSFASTSARANGSPNSEARKFTSVSYSRKTQMTTSPTIEIASNLSGTKGLGKLSSGDVLKPSASCVEQAKDESETAFAGLRTPEEDQNGSFSGKRKTAISSGISKLQKRSHSEEAWNKENPVVESAAEGLKPVSFEDPASETSNRLLRGAETPYLNEIAAISSKRKTHSLQISPKGFNAIASEMDFGSGEDGMVGKSKSVEKSYSASKSSELEKSNPSSNSEIKEPIADSNPKPVKRKLSHKKFAPPNQKVAKKNTTNQKGSIYLKNNEPSNDAGTSSIEVPELSDGDGFAYNEKLEKVPPTAKLGTAIEIEMNDDVRCETVAGDKALSNDDETEPPEDKDVACKDKHQEGEPERARCDVHKADRNDEKDEDKTEHGSLTSIKGKGQVDKSDDIEIVINEKTSRGKKLPITKRAKKKTVLSVREVTDKKGAKKKGLEGDKKLQKKNELTPHQADNAERNENVNDLQNSTEVEKAEDNNDGRTEDGDSTSVKVENLLNQKRNTRLGTTKKNTVLSAKDATDIPTVNKELASGNENKKRVKKGKPNQSLGNKTTRKEAIDLEKSTEVQKENRQIQVNDQTNDKKAVSNSVAKFPKKAKSGKVDCKAQSDPEIEPKWFILSGHQLQKKEFQKIIQRLKGKVCRVSHKWSYQATHFIAPDIRRTEKFFAAAATGSWILKTDYLSASNQAGKFLPEEPYEWHGKGLNAEGLISLEAPRKWRLLKQKTGHGAFYNMQIVIYGECIAPPLDTLKRVIKAANGTILATSPPYTRVLNKNVDFAVVSPGMPQVDMWVQEFIKHEIPCVSADYLVEYVCKPGHSLEGHVHYNTNGWAQRSYRNLKERSEETAEPPPGTPPDGKDLACEVCGSCDRGEEMLICGDESGSVGCGVGTHIDCCDPPFGEVPEEDWFCPKCRQANNSKSAAKKGTKRKSSSSRGK